MDEGKRVNDIFNRTRAQWAPTSAAKAFFTMVLNVDINRQKRL